MAVTESRDRPLFEQASQCFGDYRAGRREALDELVELLTPLLWHTVRSQGLERSAAEDAVQTVWLHLVSGADAIRDPTGVLAWLLTSARREAWRTAARMRADRTRSRPLDPEVAPDGVPGQEPPRLHGDAASVPSPEREVLVRHDDAVLWSHVAALPQRCRQLLCVIAFAERPDYAAIAASLGLPVGSIGPTRGRCLAKLRVALAADPRWNGQEA